MGGGYDDPGLSDITLAWMIERAQQHGLRFEPAYLARLNPDSLGELRDSRAGLVNKLLYRRRLARLMPERNDEDEDNQKDPHQQTGCHIHYTVERRLRNRIMPYQPTHLPKRFWRYPQLPIPQEPASSPEATP